MKEDDLEKTGVSSTGDGVVDVGEGENSPSACLSVEDGQYGFEVFKENKDGEDDGGRDKVFGEKYDLPSLGTESTSVIFDSHRGLELGRTKDTTGSDTATSSLESSCRRFQINFALSTFSPPRRLLLD